MMKYYYYYWLYRFYVYMWLYMAQFSMTQNLNEWCCLFGSRPSEVPVEAAAPTSAHSCGGSIGGVNKLQCPAPISRLRVEKIEGGLMVAGVVVAANCQIVLPIFGFLFLLVGCVLTGQLKNTRYLAMNSHYHPNIKKLTIIPQVQY